MELSGPMAPQLEDLVTEAENPILMIENDPDLEEALRGAPADLWRQLFEAARGYLAEPEHASWAGGQQIDTAVVDGAERPAFQMPYAVYSENVGRIVALLNEIGVVFPFDWSG